MADKSVYAIFKTEEQLINAVERLQEEGFRADDVSVLLPDMASRREFGHVKASKVPEGAAAGLTAGAAIGGTLGWLAGIGAIAIPGVGPFIAAGPVMGLLAGLGTGSSVGALTGALVGLGIPEYEAKRFEGQLREGRFLISVHCDNDEWADRAEDILEACGGDDVGTKTEAAADFPVQGNR